MVQVFQRYSDLFVSPVDVLFSPAESFHFHGIPRVRPAIFKSYPGLRTTFSPPRVSVSPVSFPYGMHYAPAGF